jgi:peptide/histidine transporter 3/4
MATELSTLFSTVNYVTPLLGAWLADTRLGRYRTILYFCSVYVLGMVACTVAAVPSVSADVHGAGKIIFFSGLFVGVAFGAGGIKPNVVVMGADQFDLSDPDQVKEKDRFFNYFYWAINLGASFSYGYLTNLAVNGAPYLGIPEEWGFFASFVVPAGAMMVAVLVFLAGTPRYVRKRPRGSALADFCAIVRAAAPRSSQGRWLIAGAQATLLGVVATVAGYFVPDGDAHLVLACGGMALLFFGVVLMVVCGQRTEWLRDAAVVLPAGSDGASGGGDGSGRFRASDVRDAAEVMRLLPYLGFLIVFWACYGQMNNNFLIQGCQMDLRIGAHSQLSAAVLNLFDTFVILALIPVFDRFIYPLYTVCTGRVFPIMSRISLGYVFCCLSMLAAAAVEWRRKAVGNIPCDDPTTAGNCNSNCAAEGTFLPMSRLSIWWQSPQFILIGIGEILTSITSYELFYSQVPESMRSVCQALNLLTTSLGFMITGGINSALSGWIPRNLDDGHLERVYLFVAVVVAATYVSILRVSKGFRYKACEEGADGVDGVDGRPGRDRRGEGADDGGADGRGPVSGLSPAAARYARGGAGGARGPAIRRSTSAPHMSPTTARYFAARTRGYTENDAELGAGPGGYRDSWSSLSRASYSHLLH